jgi:hypothetical protein
MAHTFRFLHIPKTAGSTFSHILMQVYGGVGRFFFQGTLSSDLERFMALPPAQRRGIRLFLGHAPLVTGIAAADQALTITLLREPISRVQSFCQHVFEGKSEYLRATYPPESFDLDRFLASGNGELSNLHTKFLINRGCCGSQRGLDGLPAADARDLALEHLFHRVAHFGLQEYFEDSLRLFTSALRWRLPKYHAENRRRSDRRLEFKPRHLEQIAALNAIDLEVYQAARRTFCHERMGWARRGALAIHQGMIWQQSRRSILRPW